VLTTTQTLKEADRYLVNNGYEFKSSTDLGTEFVASYEFGNLKAKPPRGITVTLHDYGNRYWNFYKVAHSEDLKERAQEMMDALRRLPGYQPPHI
jgi:hypothetical protein